MATFRVYKESGNFVTVHKDFIHDSNISWKAKGILLYLLSRPDDWQIYETELEQHSTDGLSGLKSGIKELEEIGYIQRNRKRDKSGRLNGYEYLVYEQPHHIRFSNVGKTVNGKTNNGKTVNGKSHSILLIIIVLIMILIIMMILIMMRIYCQATRLFILTVMLLIISTNAQVRITNRLLRKIKQSYVLEQMKVFH